MAQIPMYLAIVDDIKHKILTNDYKPNEYVGTQIDLAKQYNTSEITSRRALMQLTKQGYVYRVKGRGTYVSETVELMAKEPVEPVEPVENQLIPQLAAPVIDQLYFVSDYFLVPEMAPNRFLIDIWNAVLETCRSHRIPVNSITDLDNPLPEDPNAGFIMILPNIVEKNKLIPLIDNTRPFVSVHGYFPNLLTSYVICDNLTGSYLATVHLIEQGHVDIVIVLTGKSLMELNQDFSLRFQGFKLAMQQYKIPLTDEHVIIVEKDDENAGFQAMQQILELPKRPTAVFFSTDRKALGGLYLLQTRNIAVPEEISIIGFDDQYFAEHLNPRLTTVNQNYAKIGKRAVEMVLEQAAGKGRWKDEIVPSLIIRESVGPPPQG